MENIPAAPPPPYPPFPPLVCSVIFPAGFSYENVSDVFFFFVSLIFTSHPSSPPFPASPPLSSPHTSTEVQPFPPAFPHPSPIFVIGVLVAQLGVPEVVKEASIPLQYGEPMEVMDEPPPPPAAMMGEVAFESHTKVPPPPPKNRVDE